MAHFLGAEVKHRPRGLVGWDRWILGQLAVAVDI